MNYLYLLLGVLFATSLVIADDDQSLCQISYLLPASDDDSEDDGSSSSSSFGSFICANSTSGSDGKEYNIR